MQGPVLGTVGIYGDELCSKSDCEQQLHAGNAAPGTLAKAPMAGRNQPTPDGWLKHSNWHQQ